MPIKVSQSQMGMTVHMTVWAPSEQQGRRACSEAFQRMREINRIMSDYEPGSELSRLCHQAGQGPVAASEELFAVLAAARRLAQLTDGLFDPTAGPVVRLWRQARQTGRPPDAHALARALNRVGFDKLLLDPEARTVELTQAGMQLDLGAIAKGYACDQAAAVLRKQGVTRFAIEAGGDKVLGGPPAGQAGWTIDRVPPQAPQLQLADCAVSISGDTLQHFEIDGQRYSHVVDLRTGLGGTAGQMCIVIAPCGVTADPLATLGTVMSVGQYQSLLEREFPNVRAYVLEGM